MNTVKKIQKGISVVSLSLASVLLATIAVAVFISVLGRYVFGTNTMWVEQYTRYALIWAVFLTGNVLIQQNELVRVDFLDHLYPKAFIRGRDIFYTILFVGILVVLFWYGWLQAVSYWGVAMSGFPLDKFWIYLSVPIGAALMLIQYFLNLIVLFFEKKGGAAES